MSKRPAPDARQFEIKYRDLKPLIPPHARVWFGTLEAAGLRPDSTFTMRASVNKYGEASFELWANGSFVAPSLCRLEDDCPFD